MRQGRIHISEVTVLDAPYLIPFKAKAWLDLSRRKAAGETIDSKNIRKHKNDVFRLTQLLDRDKKPLPGIPETIRKDMREFIGHMHSETVDLKLLGILNESKESILNGLSIIYG